MTASTLLGSRLPYLEAQFVTLRDFAHASTRKIGFLRRMIVVQHVVRQWLDHLINVVHLISFQDRKKQVNLQADSQVRTQKDTEAKTFTNVHSIWEPIDLEGLMKWRWTSTRDLACQDQLPQKIDLGLGSFNVPTRQPHNIAATRSHTYCAHRSNPPVAFE
ncbi:uncharacterized protein M421DRAFT_140542 [Didymella exigua CBS 183.55]|uniref:Uncharacterized protein n=1 Tax=Didymella exigua CBS 183.55 TaxID=1150837 RepID=A0A6A5RR84_9PLEO|nr:uncharacterized protein M421DRAFT_140542 [Didymella exigua CBS 183.55]KAF1928826.1 hypothetical protein M421DRAFT_140542 [Didymella exigua CBS 183.55]